MSGRSTKAAVVAEYPQRIRAFRASLIDAMPRAPNDLRSRRALEQMPTRRIILHFLTWRMRTVPAKPRKVVIWAGGVKPEELREAAPRLAPLMLKVEAGEDLTPYLSNAVKTKGVVLPGATASDRRADIDMVLTRSGLHHFHVPTGGKSGSRSGPLVFAEVLEKEFRLVAISDHRAFETGSPEHLRFFGICQSYMARDVPPGQAFMANPVMSSGHSLLVTMFSDHCADFMEKLDPQIDDPSYVDTLYAEPDAAMCERPIKPRLNWHFEDTQFGLIEQKTRVFFRFFPFFAR